MKSSVRRWIPAPLRWFSLVALLGYCWIVPVQSQDNFGGGADLFPNLSLGGFGADTAEPVEWLATYQLDESGTGQLDVTATLGGGWHIYSMTQPAGGPTPTKLSVTGPAGVKLTGKFTPDRKPHSTVSTIYKGINVEEFESSVTWSVGIQAVAGFDGKISVDVNGLVCKTACMPVNESLQAVLVNTSTKAADKDTVQLTSEINTESSLFREVAKPFRDGDYAVKWTAFVFPTTVKAGQWGELIFTAEPDAAYHLYETAVDDADLSTNFVVTEKSGLQIGKPVANRPVIQKKGFLPYGYFKGKVTWRIPFMVPTTTKPGSKTIGGMIAYQACTDGSCLQPQALKFKATLAVGESTVETPAAVMLTSGRSGEAKDTAAETKWVDPISKPANTPKSPAADDISSTGAGTDTDASPPLGSKTKGDVARANTTATVDSESEASTAFALILLLAFFAGLILNVMPCVLPVVGLKIMGFVSQAGEDRKRILTLNLAYVLGIMAVFALLAAVAAASSFGWGQQFTLFPVRLGLTLGLFALALSYLDVWEIPVPGMAAGKTSQELQSREGLLGAFSKGVFATVMATPCSGPMLGVILGLTIGLPAIQTIIIVLTVGIGMSSPYLLIGFRPKLIAWLPKPGDWMVTLKQLMAFLILAAVAFFFAQFNDAHKVPVFVSLIAVWFGCWIIGQVPNYEALDKRIMAWIGGITAAVVLSLGAFHYLQQVKELDWQDYNEARLQELRNDGKTVLVDFGAKWCVNCIVNYEIALNTATTAKVMDELGAVAMYADWTDPDEQIKKKLEELNSRSIPILVIYPGDRSKKPIIMRDLVSQRAVVDALRQAGASVGSSSLAFTGRQEKLDPAIPQ